MVFGRFSFQGTGHLELHEVVKKQSGDSLMKEISSPVTTRPR